MPETMFNIEWPDGTHQSCYSPSLIVKEYFTPGEEYQLKEFVNLSRTALNIASDRVKAAYGFPCSKALNQLKQIELKASKYEELKTPKIKVLNFIDL